MVRLDEGYTGVRLEEDTVCQTLAGVGIPFFHLDSHSVNGWRHALPRDNSWGGRGGACWCSQSHRVGVGVCCCQGCDTSDRHCSQNSSFCWGRTLVVTVGYFIACTLNVSRVSGDRNCPVCVVSVAWACCFSFFTTDVSIEL